jgi:hypothetical protein
MSPDKAKSHLLVKVPVKETLFMFPQRHPLDRGTPFLEPMVYSLIFLKSPRLRSCPMKQWENIRSPSTEPHADRRLTYSGKLPGSPSGCYTTLLLLPHCHAAFSTTSFTLAWVDQSPVCWSVIVTLYRLYPPHLLPPPRDPGYGSARKPEVRTRGWIYGRQLLG